MTIYWVDGDGGNDGWPGTESQPWKTYGYAITQVSASDTINIVKTSSPYTAGLTVTGSHPNNVTIQAANPANPAVIAMSAQWRFDAVDGWTVKDLDFNGFTTQAINLGFTTQTTNFTIDGCKLRHSTKSAVRIEDADGVTIRDTLIRDVRSRSAGVGRIPITVTGYGYCKDLLMQRCYGEDNGDKTFENIDGSVLIDAVIEDCAFWVNRPYSTSGTSPYDGATTTWQNFSSNVSEAGLDFKGYGTGYTQNVLVRRCYFGGFYEAVSGQDCTNSVGTNGSAVVVHDDADDITFEDCVMYDCDVGPIVSKGTGGTTAGAALSGCFIHRMHDFGIDVRNANVGFSFDDGFVVGSVLVAIRMSDVTVDSIKRNLFIDGTCTRGTPMVGEANIDYNLWKNITPPSQWVGSNDLTEAQVSILGLDALGGQIVVEYQLESTGLALEFAPVVLAYHPSLSILQTDADRAMLTGTALTLTADSVLVEQ